MTSMIGAIVCLGVVGLSPPVSRAEDAHQVLQRVRAEAVRISPYLAGVLPWRRIERDLINSATPPDPWLARGFILVAAFYLEGWPTDQQVNLLRRWRQDENAVVRLLTVQMLAREAMVEAGCVTDLREAAHDADPRVSLVVDRFLIERGDDPAAFDALLRCLSSDEPRIREAAVSMLNAVARERWGWATPAAALPGSLRLTADQRVLLAKALKSPHRPVQWTAAEIVGMSGDASLSSVLMATAAAEQEGGRPARTCYRALGYLGAREAVPFLLKAVEWPHGGSKTGREAPAEAVAWTGRREAIAGLVGLLGRPATFRAALSGLAKAFNPEVAAAGNDVVPQADGTMAGRLVADSDREAVQAAWQAFVKTHLDRLTWDRDRRVFVVTGG